MRPWTPELLQTAQETISQIKGAVPHLEVLFMGAGALGLPGKNDIDLDVLCAADEIAETIERLVAVLGRPEEATDTLGVWRLMRNGFEIDCVLSDPKISHVPAQRRVFERLKSNAQLRERYRQLKLACDGLPLCEYERLKQEFFQELMRDLPSA